MRSGSRPAGTMMFADDTAISGESTERVKENLRGLEFDFL